MGRWLSERMVRWIVGLVDGREVSKRIGELMDG